MILVNVNAQPVSFFDKTPVGRIVTRFSKDMDQVSLSTTALPLG